MTTRIILTQRDFDLFDDISRFGFTTTEHYVLKFGLSYSQACRRFHLLVRNKYLKVLGKSKATNRLFYVPSFNFHRIYSSKYLYKLNPNLLIHDEYILKLYSILYFQKWGEWFEVEQDFKKRDDHKDMLRVPDLVVHNSKGNYIFEYERTVKNEDLYARISAAYENLDESQNYFVFICESQKLAQKIKEKMRFRYMAIVNPKELLESLVNQKYELLAHHFRNEKVNYFYGKGF